jgi:hypothetical protein
MTFRATANIYVGGVVLAYTPGDVVPDSAVENLKAHDKVERVDEPRAPRARRAAKPKAPAVDAPQDESETATSES